MKLFAAIAFLTFTCAGKFSAQVIQYEIDPSFNSGMLFFRGAVSDIVYTSTNQYLINGMFSSTSLSNGLLSTEGDLIHSNFVCCQKNAEYLGGFLGYGSYMLFTDINGLRDFEFEFFRPAYTGGLSAHARDVLILSDNNILVAGRFFTDSTLMGTSIASQGLRQLCMIDSTGAPVPGFPMLRCEWPTDAEINRIRQLSTGEYIISGSFNEVDGNAYAKLAKLNADFTVNTDFQPVFEPNVGFLGAYAPFIDSQDRIWVTRDPDLMLINAPQYPSNLIRLLPNGAIDPEYAAPEFGWYATGTYENPGEWRKVTANVMEDEDGTFILYGGFIEVNGEPMRRLIKINDSGEVIAGAFNNLTADSATWGSWVPANGSVMGARLAVIRKLPDGKLLIGGQFSSFGAEPYSCLVRLQPSGFVGVNEKEGKGRLKIWPNPANGFIRLSVPNVNGQITRVEIVDLQSRIVRTYQDINEGNELDLSGLNAGIYLVRACSDQGVYTRKLIIAP
jgi:hypothetical protein